MKRIKPGDVFLLPLKDERFVSAKIIWVSKLFKSAIGYVLLPKIFVDKENIEIEEGNYVKLDTYSGLRTIFYSYGTNIRKGVWPVVGELPLSESDCDLLYHIVGQNLYKGDDLIKELEEDDYRLYHDFALAGNQAVLNSVDRAFENDTEGKKGDNNIEIKDSLEVVEGKAKGSYP